MSALDGVTNTAISSSNMNTGGNGFFGSNGYVANRVKDALDWIKAKGLEGAVNTAGGLINGATDIAVLQYGAVKGPVGNIINKVPGLKLMNLGAGLIGKGFGGMFGPTKYDFFANQETLEQIGGDYMGYANNLLQNNGKAFKKSKWNDLAMNMLRMNNLAGDIRDNTQAVANTSDALNIKYANKVNGLNFDHAYAAKLGMKIQLVKSRMHPKHDIKKEVELLKLGGHISWSPTYYKPEWKPTYYEIEKFLNGGNVPKLRTLEELITYAKEQNPRFILRMSEPIKSIEFILDDGSKGTGTHYMEYSENDNGDYVYPRIQEMDDKSLKLLSSDEAYKRSKERKNGLLLNKGEGKIFTEGYKSGWPEFFLKFKEGGKTKESENAEEQTEQKSIIPEGALHAHKHHMEDDENITKKGIPVVDMNGLQQAEIEKNEIIFNLHLTNLLEKLYKDFYEEGTTLKRKDELAIEAGKLITCDIMTNLDDRTGLVDKCEKGGKLNEPK